LEPVAHGRGGTGSEADDKSRQAAEGPASYREPEHSTPHAEPEDHPGTGPVEELAFVPALQVRHQQAVEGVEAVSREAASIAV
jgi:hypothetical protein